MLYSTETSLDGETSLDVFCGFYNSVLMRPSQIFFINFKQGDLGAIDDKYDVAISTCCVHLDSIVTDTINTAQQCVQYLKTLILTIFILISYLGHQFHAEIMSTVYKACNQ